MSFTALPDKIERVNYSKITLRAMRNFKVDEYAVSPVIGVVLMVGMTVIMVSAVAVSVFAFSVPESAPQARIVMVEARGDIDESLYKNFIVLKHKGGDALDENNTKIIITGKGYAYTGGDPYPLPAQDIRVTYRDLTGKNYYYTGQKQIVEGTTWDAGESITLYGYDGHNIGTIFDQGNTVDNKWKLDACFTVSVTIIDTTTNEIITVSQATVKDV
ncbi:MAG: type IV pilin N-terminal domain-containing protein [Candidatus Methanoperedens sp.]